MFLSAILKNYFLHSFPIQTYIPEQNDEKSYGTREKAAQENGLPPKGIEAL